MSARSILAVFFIFIILIGGIFVYVYRVDLFTNHADIYYTNGCHERYVDSKLVTPKCPEENSDIFNHSYNISPYKQW
jgi:hypothetical protein